MSISPAKPKTSISSSDFHSANPSSTNGFTSPHFPIPPFEFSTAQCSIPPSPSENNGVLAAEGSIEPAKKVNEICETNTQSDGKGCHPSHPKYRKNGITFNHENGPCGSPSQSTGKKSQIVNANHLLNFQYKAVSHERLSQPLFPRKQPKPRPYNKDLFLQANYKFVLLDTGNYVPEAMDPDRMLTWEDVICVKYLTPQPVECPICLEHPLCPQITSCGHIFCFPCILRYLFGDREDLKSNIMKKCPLCFVPMCSKDMCTVYLVDVKNYCVGDDIEFILLTRHKDSSVPSNRYNMDIGCKNEAHDSFLKFTITSDVSLSIAKAKSDLDCWLEKVDSGVNDGLEKLPFVCAALELLEQRKKYWDEVQIKCCRKAEKYADGGKGSLSLDANVVENRPTSHKLPSNDDKGKHSKLDEIFFQMDGADNFLGYDEVLQTSLKGPVHPKSDFRGIRDTKINDFYNFYQSVDGQLFILHPLNMKCLLNYYGSYDLLPDRIKGKILQLDTITQSETMRRRYRYLSHFSLTTTFQICEIDISEILPVDSLFPFAEEIKTRGKQRNRIAKQEKANKIKSESSDTYFIPNRYDLSQLSDHLQPEFSKDDFEVLGGSCSISTSPPASVGRMLFSNVAKLGYAARYESPALNLKKNSTVDFGMSFETTGVGMNGGCVESFAAVTTKGKPVEKMERNDRKGKKPAKVLFSTAGSRRY